MFSFISNCSILFKVIEHDLLVIVSKLDTNQSISVILYLPLSLSTLLNHKYF